MLNDPSLSLCSAECEKSGCNVSNIPGQESVSLVENRFDFRMMQIFPDAGPLLGLAVPVQDGNNWGFLTLVRRFRTGEKVSTEPSSPRPIAQLARELERE